MWGLNQSVNETTKIKNWRKYGVLSKEKNLFGHISVYHEDNNHKVWLFLYDKDKTHESESHGKDIKQDNKLVKKFKGLKPNLKELEAL